MLFYVNQEIERNKVKVNLNTPRLEIVFKKTKSNLNEELTKRRRELQGYIKRTAMQYGALKKSERVKKLDELIKAEKAKYGLASGSGKRASIRRPLGFAT